MTITSNISYHSPIFAQSKQHSAAAKTVQPARVQPMSGSLWRHTQDEDAAHIQHGWVVRTMYCIVGTLGLGSVSYALWQLCTLMSGSHLQDAVSAFAR